MIFYHRKWETDTENQPLLRRCGWLNEFGAVGDLLVVAQSRAAVYGETTLGISGGSITEEMGTDR